MAISHAKYIFSESLNQDHSDLVEEGMGGDIVGGDSFGFIGVVMDFPTIFMDFSVKVFGFLEIFVCISL